MLPQVASIYRIEAHGPAAEIAQLKEPLKDFPLEYWEKVARAGSFIGSARVSMVDCAIFKSVWCA